jgi:subfamily B ATP-binding cassette protein MsbA
VHNFRRFLRFLRPYKLPMALALLMMFTTTGINISVPLIMGKIWDRMWKLYSNELDRAEGPRFLLLACLLLIGIRVLIGLIGYAQSMTLIRMGQRILFDIRQKLYRHLQTLSMRYYETQHTGWIMARVLWDVDRVAGLMQGQLLDIISQSVTLIAVVVFLLYKNWHLALIGMIVLPLYAINFSLFR